LNYYSENGEYVEVPLDENLLPQENAQRYFKKYAKAKAAYIHATQQLEEARGELSYLESVLHSLKTAILSKILTIYGRNLPNKGICLQRKKGRKRKIQKTLLLILTSPQTVFISMLGKNNVQNDFLTLKFASSNDIWLHTKNIPGSHVIIRKDRGEIPDSTLFQAAMLAAYHSKAKNSSMWRLITPRSKCKKT